MSSSSGFLKDISNMPASGRKLGTAFPPVNVEDKENADPRPKAFTTEAVIKPSVVIEQPDSESSHDGFDVTDDIVLDEAGVSDGEEPEKEDKAEPEDPSPLVMSSLLHSRVVFKIEDDTNIEDDNGASPMFPLAPVARQERRKLDFTNMGGASPVSSTSPASAQRRFMRRCISMVEGAQKLQLNTVASSPEIKNCHEMTTTSPLARPFASFKRPNAPLQPLQNLPTEWQPSKKLRRGLSMHDNRNIHELGRTIQESSPLVGSASTSNIDSPQIAKPMLQLSLSESEANIKKACSLADVPNLTGDRSRSLSLPTVPGTGRTAKSLVNVDCHTVADLLQGKYDDKVASYRIIDARYTYEYKGGHIRGAENFGSWDEEAFFSEFLPRNLGARRSLPREDEKAHILIFHCEFSSARGPALMALLRNRDRELNKETYPALHYPECYLLSEGYKEFYNHHPDLCEPKGYVPMAHPNFASEERKFHKKSRSWAPGGTMSRTGSSSRLLKL